MKTTSGRTLDHVAHIYDVLSPLMLFGQEGRISSVCLNWLEDPCVTQVLDVGCGTGTLTVLMAQKLQGRNGSYVIGMDAAPKMIDVARAKVLHRGNVRFDVGIAEEQLYDDDSFDLVVSTFFFHHINMELKVKALNEIWRVLKKGAEVVIIDVDVPVSFFGKICAWAGYFIFQQEEIRENIEGKLRLAIEQSKFKRFEVISTYQGYITVFKLVKIVPEIL